MIESLFSTYIDADVLLSDFVTALTPGAPGFATTLTVLLITFLLGFLVYVYSFVLVLREGSAPYPVWLHTFYFAADLMGVFVFWCAWNQCDHFWFFMLGCIGEIVWVGFEIFCLWQAVTTERVAIWGTEASIGKAVLWCLAQIAIFFVSLNFLRVELGDVSMFKFWIFTQVLIVCVPGMFWSTRKTRVGTCWQLVIVLVLVAVMSFNPGNMWALISPNYFGLEANPWYYAMGAVVCCFAVYDVWIYAKLPKKPERLENGKKPIW